MDKVRRPIGRKGAALSKTPQSTWRVRNDPYNCKEDPNEHGEQSSIQSSSRQPARKSGSSKLLDRKGERTENNSRHINLAFDRGRIWVRSSCLKEQYSNRSFLSCENSGQMESALKFVCEPSKQNPLRVNSRRAKKWAGLGLPSMEFALVTRIDCRYLYLGGSKKTSFYNKVT